MEICDDGSEVVLLLEMRHGIQKSGKKGQRLKKKKVSDQLQGGRDQKGRKCHKKLTKVSYYVVDFTLQCTALRVKL